MVDKNYHFAHRIKQVLLFHRHKYGTALTSKIVEELIKEILIKLEPVLLKAKSKEDILTIIEFYFTIEYEIDGIFINVAEKVLE